MTQSDTLAPCAEGTPLWPRAPKPPAESRARTSDPKFQQTPGSQALWRDTHMSRISTYVQTSPLVPRKQAPAREYKPAKEIDPSACSMRLRGALRPRQFQR